MNMRYFLKLGYHGKNYFGWQRQPKQLSVQEVLEEKLSILLRESIHVVGAGRTDTGVHAKTYFAHFDSQKIQDPSDFIFRMNSFLPEDIVLYDIFEVQPDAHARFDAEIRTYEYRVCIGKDPFKEGLAYRVSRKPDVEKMNEAASFLIGERDYQCFSRSGSDVKTFVCRIQKAFWTEDGNELVFTIAANRFLRNMVRAIVGTLLEIGFGKMEVANMEKIIESKDRALAGPSAAAHGLYLIEVLYPKEIFIDKMNENKLPKPENV